MKDIKANIKDWKYIRGISPDKDEDFASAKPYGNARLGSDSLFWKKGLKWYCVDFSQTVRVFRRVAEVNSRVCFGNSNFDIQMLVFITYDGKELEAIIGDSLLRHEAEALYDMIKSAHPELHYGKPEV